jgi:hypothetical protein
MTIYLHRANSLKEIERAIKLKIGVEIDIRTHRQEPHLAHDPMIGWEHDVALEEAIKILAKHKVPTILDIKETGLIDSIIPLLGNEFIKLCVATDLIVPDQINSEQKGLKTLSRWSVYEKIKLDTAWGYWLDFISSPDDLRGVTGQRPIPEHTFLVSPELHKHRLSDEFIRIAKRRRFEGVCTDFPERWM